MKNTKTKSSRENKMKKEKPTNQRKLKLSQKKKRGRKWYNMIRMG